MELSISYFFKQKHKTKHNYCNYYVFPLVNLRTLMKLHKL